MTQLPACLLDLSGLLLTYIPFLYVSLLNQLL